MSPFPPKLVEKIRALKFVDMKELLPDNIMLLKSIEAIHPNSFTLAPANKPRFREVQSLLTWITCFASYIAILSETHPHMVRPLIAYECLVIREARKNGGQGWMLYDRIFRQNAQEDPSVDWTKLDASLHASTFLAMRSAPGVVCPWCFASDHDQGECALAPLQAPSPAGYPALANYPGPARLMKRAGERIPTMPPLCISWNKGRCFRSPAPCNYRHVCASCGREDHPACNCASSPPDSFYRRPATNCFSKAARLS